MNRFFDFLFVCAAFVACRGDGPRSVNLALETSLLFEPKDAFKHLKFIADARKFLDKLESAIAPRHEALRSDNEAYLTEFLTNLGETLLTYDDVELQQFFVSLEFEMRVHYYKGSIFREILYDPKLLTYFRRILKEWANTDPRMMRAKINKYMLSDRNDNTPLNRLGVFLNDYYHNDENEVMKEVIEKLRNIDDGDELGGVIRDAVSDLVIEHYDSMNYTTRAKLADEISKLNDYAKFDKGDVDEDLKLYFRKFLGKISGKSEFQNLKEIDEVSNKTISFDTKTVVRVNAITDENSEKAGSGVKEKVKKRYTISVHKTNLTNNIEN